MTVKEASKELAAELGLSAVFVERVYNSYWRAIREHVTSLPLKEDLTDEEFLQLRPNINICSLGKMYVTLDRYKRLKKSLADYQESKKTKNK